MEIPTTEVKIKSTRAPNQFVALEPDRS